MRGYISYKNDENKKFDPKINATDEENDLRFELKLNGVFKPVVIIQTTKQYKTKAVFEIPLDSLKKFIEIVESKK